MGMTRHPTNDTPSVRTNTKRDDILNIRSTKPSFIQKALSKNQSLLRVCLACLSLTATSLAINASVIALTDLHFSIEELSENLQGNTVKDHQMWRYNPSSPDGTEISGPTLDGAITGVPSTSDIDAYSIKNQIHYFSLRDGSGGTALRVDGQKFDRDVIIAYDASQSAGNRATTFFDPAPYMTTSLQVDGFSFTDDNTILLSFANNGNFAGTSVSDGDIVRFDPADPTGTVSTFFDESIFLNATDGSDNENIIAFEFRFDDLLYLSTSSSAKLPGMGADFQKSDVIGWDGTMGWVALDSSDFDAASDITIDAFYAIPEPETWALVFALVCLVALGVKRD